MTPRSSAPTRVAILGAASELLETGGPDAVTLRAVGEMAGVSRAAPYRHFADKAALMQSLATQTLDGLAAGVRSASAGKSPVEAARRGCQAYVAAALARPNHYLLIFGDAPLMDPLPEVELAADAAMASLVELVAGLQEAGHLGGLPAREAATVLWVSLHGIAQLQLTGHLHEPRTLDGNARLHELIDLSIRMLGIPAEDSGSAE